MATRCAALCLLTLSAMLCVGQSVIITPTPFGGEVDPKGIPAELCQDKLSDCAKNAAYCGVPAYRDFMSRQCPKTCNRCTAMRDGTCFDSSTNCAQWAAAGFCSSTWSGYTDQVKKQYCASTCGFC